MRLGSLLLVGAAMAIAPSSALALTPKESKAVNVTSIDGASTATAAFVKIRFKGQLADRSAGRA